MKLYVLTFTNVQNNEKHVEVYPTLKLAQIYMKGKRDDAIASSNILDLIVNEDDYGCYVQNTCEITIDEVEMNWHDFIAHKIVEHICDSIKDANLYYNVIYNIVNDFYMEDYPNIDDKDDIDNFINYKLLNTMAYCAAKKLTDGIKPSYEELDKVVSYLHDNVYICHLAKIINGEMITQYQIQYDSENPTETLFNHKKVWALSSCMYGGGCFSPDFKFRLFDDYDNALNALVDEHKNVLLSFIANYGADVSEEITETPNITTYELSEKKNHDDYWVGKIEVRYIE